MAGIYVHIPFCHRACPYCDFYFLTNVDRQDAYVEALVKEIKGRRAGVEEIETVYFGGGTPSILSPKNLEKVVRQIRESYEVEPELEFTLEANPEDLIPEKLKLWTELGVNRLSVGVQSTNPNRLELLGRNHSVQQAMEGIEAARSAGIERLNLDLIFATGRDESLAEELEQFIALKPSHISAYGLTVEEGTPLARNVEKERRSLVEEDEFGRQFKAIHESLVAAGYDHYEISNYGLAGQRSLHNWSYWNGVPYLGFGPAAHSFDGTKRRWNEASLKDYLENPSFEEEVLTETDRFNEIIMTSLRQAKGLDLYRMEEEFPGSEDEIIEASEEFLQKGLIIRTWERLRLSLDGMLISDHICSKLFRENED